MAYRVGSHGFLDQLCRALGIDPRAQAVRRIVLDVPVDGPVVAYVQQFVADIQAALVVNELAALPETDRPVVVEARKIVLDDAGNIKVM